MTKERLEELLEYLLHQKELLVKWKEEDEVLKVIEERHGNAAGVRIKQRLISMRENEIAKVNDLLDIIQEAHFHAM
jgi:hypothetical protein